MDARVALVGSQDPKLGEAIREQLVQHGLHCDHRRVVGLDQLVDRAILDCPQLVVFVQPDDLHEAAAVVRELSIAGNSHIIALGPADDARRIMALMQAGIHEYVDVSLWRATLRDALARFSSRSHAIARLQEPARIIGILSSSGGGGASTVATNVATALAQQHADVLLMDLRLESGDLTALLDLSPQFSMADLSTNLERLDDGVFDQLLATHASGVKVLAAPGDVEAAQRVTPKAFRRALAMARWKFPYVVADLGNGHTPMQHEATALADVVAIILRLDYPSIRNARRTYDRFCEIGMDPAKFRFVVNRFGESRQLSTTQAQDALGAKLDILLPDDAANMNAAINSGQPVVLRKPRCRLARRLVELSSSLNGRHDK
jgi:pilus assembly protein CpaE